VSGTGGFPLRLRCHLLRWPAGVPGRPSGCVAGWRWVGAGWAVTRRQGAEETRRPGTRWGFCQISAKMGQEPDDGRRSATRVRQRPGSLRSDAVEVAGQRTGVQLPVEPGTGLTPRRRVSAKGNWAVAVHDEGDRVAGFCPLVQTGGHGIIAVDGDQVPAGQRHFGAAGQHPVGS